MFYMRSFNKNDKRYKKYSNIYEDNFIVGALYVLIGAICYSGYLLYKWLFL
jgi:hypothetical protein